MVGTPMYGMKCYGPYLKSILSLMEMCNELGIEISFSTICNESLIQRCRNYIMDDFLRSNKTHLLFIDADIGFTPESVIELLLMDKDIIGAHYTSKKINWDRVAKAPAEKMHRLAGDLHYNISNPKEVVETDVLPTGFMLIKRHVLEQIQVVYPENFYIPDHNGMSNFNGHRRIQMFFTSEIDPNTGRLLAEYEFFCKTWKKIGGKIYTCPWIVLTHIGTHKY